VQPLVVQYPEPLDGSQWSYGALQLDAAGSHSAPSPAGVSAQA
jgi:hypothetical protein